MIGFRHETRHAISFLSHSPDTLLRTNVTAEMGPVHLWEIVRFVPFSKDLMIRRLRLHLQAFYIRSLVLQDEREDSSGFETGGIGMTGKHALFADLWSLSDGTAESDAQ